MDAREVPIAERIEPYVTRRLAVATPTPTLGNLLDRMHAAIGEFDSCWRQAVNMLAPPAPFNDGNVIDRLLTESEEEHRYTADEDDWALGGHHGPA
jgi:hypothetical protein